MYYGGPMPDVHEPVENIAQQVPGATVHDVQGQVNSPNPAAPNWMQSMQAGGLKGLADYGRNQALSQAGQGLAAAGKAAGSAIGSAIGAIL